MNDTIKRLIADAQKATGVTFSQEELDSMYKHYGDDVELAFNDVQKLLSEATGINPSLSQIVAMKAEYKVPTTWIETLALGETRSENLAVTAENDVTKARGPFQIIRSHHESDIKKQLGVSWDEFKDSYDLQFKFMNYLEGTYDKLVPELRGMKHSKGFTDEQLKAAVHVLGPKGARRYFSTLYAKPGQEEQFYQISDYFLETRKLYGAPLSVKNQYDYLFNPNATGVETTTSSMVTPSGATISTSQDIDWAGKEADVRVRAQTPGGGIIQKAKTAPKIENPSKNLTEFQGGNSQFDFKNPYSFLNRDQSPNYITNPKTEEQRLNKKVEVNKKKKEAEGSDPYGVGKAVKNIPTAADNTYVSNQNFAPYKNYTDREEMQIAAAEREKSKRDFSAIDNLDTEKVYPTGPKIDWKNKTVVQNTPVFPEGYNENLAKQKFSEKAALEKDIYDGSINILKKEFGENFQDKLSSLFTETQSITDRIDDLTAYVEKTYGKNALPEIGDRSEIIKRSQELTDLMVDADSEVRSLAAKIENYNSDLTSLAQRIDAETDEITRNNLIDKYNSLLSEANNTFSTYQQKAGVLDAYSKEYNDLNNLEEQIVKDYNKNVSKLSEAYKQDPKIKKLEELYGKYKTNISEIDKYRNHPRFSSYIKSANSLKELGDKAKILFPNEEEFVKKKQQIQKTADLVSKGYPGSSIMQTITSTLGTAIGAKYGVKAPATGIVGLAVNKFRDKAYNLLGDVMAIGASVANIASESLAADLTWNDVLSVQSLKKDRELNEAYVPSNLQGDFRESFIEVKSGDIFNKNGLAVGDRVAIDDGKIINFRDKDGYKKDLFLTQETRKKFDEYANQVKGQAQVDNNFKRGFVAATPSAIDFASLMIGGGFLSKGMVRLGVSKTVAPNASVFGSSMFQMYGDNYQQYIEEGQSISDAALFSLGKSAAVSMVEAIVGPIEAKLIAKGAGQEALRKLSKVKETSIDLFAKGKMNRSDLLSTIGIGLVSTFKELGLENVEEFVQSEIETAIDNFALNQNEKVSVDRQINTIFATTLITMGPAMLAGAGASMNARADLYNSSLYNATQNKDEFLEVLNKAEEEGYRTSEEATRLKSLVEYVSQEIEDYDADYNLTEVQKASLAGLINTRFFYETKAATATNPRVKENNKKKIDQVDEEIQKVLDGDKEVEVDPSVEEVFTESETPEQFDEAETEVTYLSNNIGKFKDGETVEIDGRTYTFNRADLNFQSPEGILGLKEITEKNLTVNKLETAEGAVQEQAKPTVKIPEEISSLKDDETVIITVKNLDEIPAQFRDRATETSAKVKVRKSVLGFPIGKETEQTINKGYRYSLTGKEIKDYAIQEQEAGQVPVQPGARGGQEVVEEVQAEPQVTTREGEAEVQVQEEVATPTQAPQATETVEAEPTPTTTEKVAPEAPQAPQIENLVQGVELTRKDGTKAPAANYRKNPETGKWGRVSEQGKFTPVSSPTQVQQLEEALSAQQAAPAVTPTPEAVAAPVTPTAEAEKAPVVEIKAEDVKVKKNSDFQMNGQWDVIYNGEVIAEMYYDRATQTWRDAAKTSARYYEDLLSTSDKKDAIREIVDQYNKKQNQQAAPAVTPEEVKPAEAKKTKPRPKKTKPLTKEEAATNLQNALSEFLDGLKDPSAGIVFDSKKAGTKLGGNLRNVLDALVDYVRANINAGAYTKKDFAKELKEGKFGKLKISPKDINLVFDEAVKPVEEVSPLKETSPEAKVNGAKYTLAEDLPIFKGTKGKRNIDGSLRTVHPGVKGSFVSASEKVAERYKGDGSVISITLPAGTTVETVSLEMGTTPASEFRQLETDAINNSDADIVRLETIDATGLETQYIIKNPDLRNQLKQQGDLETTAEVKAEAKAEPISKEQALENLKAGLKDFFAAFPGANAGIAFDPIEAGRSQNKAFRQIAKALVDYIRAALKEGEYTPRRFSAELKAGKIAEGLKLLEMKPAGIKYLFEQAAKPVGEEFKEEVKEAPKKERETPKAKKEAPKKEFKVSELPRFIERILDTEGFPQAVKDYLVNNVRPKEVISNAMTSKFARDFVKNLDPSQYRDAVKALKESLANKSLNYAGADLDVIQDMAVWEILALREIATILSEQYGDSKQSAEIYNIVSGFYSFAGRLLQSAGRNPEGLHFIRMFARKNTDGHVFEEETYEGSGVKNQEALDEIESIVEEELANSQEEIRNTLLDGVKNLNKKDTAKGDTEDKTKTPDKENHKRSYEKVVKDKKDFYKAKFEETLAKYQKGFTSGIPLDLLIDYTLYKFYEFGGSVLKARRALSKKFGKDIADQNWNSIISSNLFKQEVDALRKAKLYGAISNPGTSQALGTNVDTTTPSQMVVQAVTRFLKGNSKKAVPQKDVESKIKRGEIEINELIEIRNDIESGLLAVEPERRAEILNEVDDILDMLAKKNEETKLTNWMKKANIRRKVKENLDNMNLVIDDLVKDLVNKNAVKASIAEEFISRSGLSAEDAKPYIELIKKTVDDILENRVKEKLNKSIIKSFGLDYIKVQDEIVKLRERLNNNKKELSDVLSKINTIASAKKDLGLSREEIEALKEKRDNLKEAIKSDETLLKGLSVKAKQGRETLKKKAMGLRRNPTFEKIAEVIRNNGLSSDDIRDVFARSMGTRVLTNKDLSALKKLQTRLDNVKFDIDKKHIEDEIKRYLFKIRDVDRNSSEVARDLFESYVYSNMLGAPRTIDVSFSSGYTIYATKLATSAAWQISKDLFKLITGLSADKGIVSFEKGFFKPELQLTMARGGQADFTNFRLFFDAMKASASLDLLTLKGLKNVIKGSEGISLTQLAEGRNISALNTLEKLEQLIKESEQKGDTAMTILRKFLLIHQLTSRGLIVSDYIIKSTILPYEINRNLQSETRRELVNAGIMSPTHAQILNGVEALGIKGVKDKLGEDRVEEVLIEEGYKKDGTKEERRAYAKRRAEIIYEFIPEESMARVQAEDAANRIAFTGRIPGYTGVVTQKISQGFDAISAMGADKKNFNPSGFSIFAASLAKLVSLPFAGAVFRHMQNVKNYTPLGLIQFKRNEEGEIIGLQSFKEFVYYDRHMNATVRIPASSHEKELRWAEAIVPSLVFGVLVASAFDFDDEEDIKIDEDFPYLFTTNYNIAVRNILEAKGVKYEPFTIYKKNKSGRIEKVGTYKDLAFGWVLGAIGAGQEKLLFNKNPGDYKTDKSAQEIKPVEITNFISLMTGAVLAFSTQSTFTNLSSNIISPTAEVISGQLEGKEIGPGALEKVTAGFVRQITPFSSLMSELGQYSDLITKEPTKSSENKIADVFSNNIIFRNFLNNFEYTAWGEKITAKPYGPPLTQVVTSAMEEFGADEAPKEYPRAQYIVNKYKDIETVLIEPIEIQQFFPKSKVTEKKAYVEVPEDPQTVEDMRRHAAILKGDELERRFKELDKLDKKELSKELTKINKEMNEQAYMTYVKPILYNYGLTKKLNQVEDMDEVKELLIKEQLYITSEGKLKYRNYVPETE